MESYLCVLAGKVQGEAELGDQGLPGKRNHWKTSLMGDDWVELGPQGIPWENPNFPCILSLSHSFFYSISGVSALPDLVCAVI